CTRFNKTRNVVVLGDLVIAKCEIVVGSDEFDGIECTGLQSLERIAGSHVGDARSKLLPDLSAEAGRTEAQTLEVGQARQFIAEPAACLGSGITRQECTNAELIIDLVPDLLTAEIADPGGELARAHPER